MGPSLGEKGTENRKKVRLYSLYFSSIFSLYFSSIFSQFFHFEKGQIIRKDERQNNFRLIRKYNELKKLKPVLHFNRSVFLRFLSGSRDLTILGRQRDGNGYQYNKSLKRIDSGGARPQNLGGGGGGHLRGKLIFGGGGDIIFKKVLLPMPLSQDFCPPTPKEIRPLSEGGDIPRNTAPGGRIS